MELKFVPATRPEKPSATILRRQKLVRRIDQQIGYVRQMIEGQNPRATWAWMDEAGSYFLSIRYGRQALELTKGMYAVQCPDLDHAEAALCTIRGMVLKGDFDAQIEKVSTDIRARFGK